MFFPVAVQPRLDLGCLGVEVYRSHTRTHTHAHTHTHSRTPLDKWSARCRCRCLQKHKTLTINEHTCPQRDSSLRVLGTRRLQTHALDRTVTGIGTYLYWLMLLCENFKRQRFYSLDFIWMERYKYSVSVAVRRINITQVSIIMCSWQTRN